MQLDTITPGTTSSSLTRHAPHPTPWPSTKTHSNTLAHLSHFIPCIKSCYERCHARCWHWECFILVFMDLDRVTSEVWLDAKTLSLEIYCYLFIFFKLIFHLCYTMNRMCYNLNSSSLVSWLNFILSYRFHSINGQKKNFYCNKTRMKLCLSAKKYSHHFQPDWTKHLPKS